MRICVAPRAVITLSVNRPRMKPLKISSLSALCFLLTVGVLHGQSQTAERKFRNIQVLKGVPAKNVNGIMRAFNRALGVQCDACHVRGEWDNESKAQFGIARKMLQMVKSLNQTQLAGTRGVSCWTCHAAHSQPSRLPRPELDDELAKWPTELANSSQTLKITMSVYNLSLHVNCDFCHLPNDWKSADKPAYKMVARMNSMFKVFPQYMPATARTQCWMCHKGSTEPKRRRPF
jgi:photosynthetic reaction center cytochrome c subunit